MQPVHKKHVFVQEIFCFISPPAFRLQGNLLPEWLLCSCLVPVLVVFDTWVNMQKFIQLSCTFSYVCMYVIRINDVLMSTLLASRVQHNVLYMNCSLVCHFIHCFTCIYRMLSPIARGIKVVCKTVEHTDGKPDRHDQRTNTGISSLVL